VTGADHSPDVNELTSCYFRTTADGGTRKALVQIDERCNLRCAYCFVSATRAGQSMPYDDITGVLIPRLRACRVERVTLKTAASPLSTRISPGSSGRCGARGCRPVSAPMRVSDPSPLLDRAGIEEAFRRLGDRLARRGVVAGRSDDEEVQVAADRCQRFVADVA
jgi:hypothetical protein